MFPACVPIIRSLFSKAFSLSLCVCLCISLTFSVSCALCVRAWMCPDPLSLTLPHFLQHTFQIYGYCLYEYSTQAPKKGSSSGGSAQSPADGAADEFLSLTPEQQQGPSRPPDDNITRAVGKVIKQPLLYIFVGFSLFELHCCIKIL